jgi:hypothetical protein
MPMALLPAVRVRLHWRELGFCRGRSWWRAKLAVWWLPSSGPARIWALRTGSSRRENAVAFAVSRFSLIFRAAGFVLARKLARRLARESGAFRRLANTRIGQNAQS